MNLSTPDEDDLSAELCLFPFKQAGQPALHYVHDVSGSVLNFVPIARELADEHDMIGFQCLGLDLDCAADQTIEQMAERYTRVLLDQGLAPSYDLIGYSMGGLIAFEMAARLSEHGARIGLLGLLDPTVPGSISDDVGVGTVVRLLGRSIGVPSIGADDCEDVDELLAILVAEAGAAGLLPASYTAEDLRPSVELRLTNAQAAARYRPAHVLPGDIQLLGAGEAGLPAQLRGWMPFTHGQVHGSAIDADHVSLVGEQNAPAVANVIRAWLDRAAG